MKLKSYLRGLGLGMIITTIILVVAFGSRNTQMTDQQIIDKALALGLVEPTLYGDGDKDENNHNDVETSGEGLVSVENQTLSMIEPSSEMTTESSGESSDETVSETVTETVSQKETETTTEKETETTTQKPTEKVTEKPTEKPTEKATEKATEKSTEPTTEASKEIVLVFENITSADKASRILYDAGIIQNVNEFNAYLTSKNLATKVGEGTFTFKKGMTFEEIAKIITNQK